MTLSVVIQAVATVALGIITGIYVRLTYRMVNGSEATVQMAREEQRINRDRSLVEVRQMAKELYSGLKGGQHENREKTESRLRSGELSRLSVEFERYAANLPPDDRKLAGDAAQAIRDCEHHLSRGVEERDFYEIRRNAAMTSLRPLMGEERPYTKLDGPMTSNESTQGQQPLVARGENPQGITEWQHSWYKEAQTDIRWAKERGWVVMYYSVLLVAAIYAAAQVITPLPAGFFFMATAFVANVSVVWLADLRGFAAKARRYVVHSLSEIGEGPSYPFSRPRDRDHLLQFASQVVVILGAGLVVSIGIYGIPASSLEWAGMIALFAPGSILGSWLIWARKSVVPRSQSAGEVTATLSGSNNSSNRMSQNQSAMISE